VSAIMITLNYIFLVCNEFCKGCIY